jgi:hypothetical protein
MEPNEDVRGVFLTDSKRTTQRSPTGSATGSVLERQDGSQERWNSIQIFFLRRILSISFTKSTGEREL